MFELVPPVAMVELVAPTPLPPLFGDAEEWSTDHALPPDDAEVLPVAVATCPEQPSAEVATIPRTTLVDLFILATPVSLYLGY